MTVHFQKKKKEKPHGAAFDLWSSEAFCPVQFEGCWNEQAVCLTWQGRRLNFPCSSIQPCRDSHTHTPLSFCPHMLSISLIIISSSRETPPPPEKPHLARCLALENLVCDYRSLALSDQCCDLLTFKLNSTSVLPPARFTANGTEWRRAQYWVPEAHKELKRHEAHTLCSDRQSRYVYGFRGLNEHVDFYTVIPFYLWLNFFPSFLFSCRWLASQMWTQEWCTQSDKR